MLNTKNKAMQPQLSKLISHLQTAQRILIFTGAGISTNSGIPDFRGPEGVWKKRQPVYYHDFMRSEAARVDHWDYKLEGWPGFRAARPNTLEEHTSELQSQSNIVCRLLLEQQTAVEARYTYAT